MYPPNQNIYSTNNQVTPRPGGYGSNGTPSPNYYNTFVQPMVPQPQPQLSGTGPSNNYTIQNGTRNPDGSISGFLPGNNQQRNYPQQQQGGGGSLSTMPTWYGEDPNSIRGSHADLSGIDQAKAFAGLGAPDLKNHDQVFQLGENLRQQGHDVKPGLTDMYGRMDSLMIDGQLTRVFDSNGNWTLKSNANNDAWWYPDGSNQGNQGTQPGYPSQGGQNDPNAWRRQNEMRRHQQPNFSGSGPIINWGPNGPGPIAGLTPNAAGGFNPYGVNGSVPITNQPLPGIENRGQTPNNPTFGSTTVGGSLNGTAPSSFVNTNGVPNNHPLNQRLMY